MRRIIGLIVIVIALINSISYGLDEPKINQKVIMDGKVLKLDVEPIAIEGRLLLPFRTIFEALGCKVEWIAETKTAKGIRNDTTIEIKIDSKFFCS